MTRMTRKDREPSTTTKCEKKNQLACFCFKFFPRGCLVSARGVYASKVHRAPSGLQSDKRPSTRLRVSAGVVWSAVDRSACPPPLVWPGTVGVGHGLWSETRASSVLASGPQRYAHGQRPRGVSGRPEWTARHIPAAAAARSGARRRKKQKQK